MAICLTNGTLISGYYALENMSVLVKTKGLDVFNQKRFEQKNFLRLCVLSMLKVLYFSRFN